MATVAALLGGMAVWLIGRRSPVAEDRRATSRLILELPDELPMALTSHHPLATGRASLALSPDGSRLVYVAERAGVTRLVIRDLDDYRTEEIPGTAGGFGPFFSPDGQWLGFFTEGQLHKI